MTQPSRWSTKIYDSSSTSTMEQCAARCWLNVLSGFTCNMFSWVANTCYIGNHDKTTSSNINPPAGDIYITPTKIPKEVADYLVVENVNSTQFSRFFGEGYNSKSTASLDSCVADYYFHSLLATTVFADATTNMCWFGLSSTSTGNIGVSASSWAVYVKLGKFLCLLSEHQYSIHLPLFLSICSNI